jgi:hypothetical protein
MTPGSPMAKATTIPAQTPTAATQQKLAFLALMHPLPSPLMRSTTLGVWGSATTCRWPFAHNPHVHSHPYAHTHIPTHSLTLLCPTQVHLLRLQRKDRSFRHLWPRRFCSSVERCAVHGPAASMGRDGVSRSVCRCMLCDGRGRVSWVQKVLVLLLDHRCRYC